MVDVSELVHQMHENLSAIHETISGLTTESHDAQLTELEQKRDSLLDELRSMFDKEQEEVTAKRQAELDEIKEKRRIEDEEREARRKQEDEDLQSKTDAEDLERHEKLDDDIRLIDEDTDKQMDEVEAAARKLIDEARLKLSELEQKRTEINRLIDEHLQAPLPEVPTRKRARADKSGDDDAVAAEEPAAEEAQAAEEAESAEEAPADAPATAEEEPAETTAAAEEATEESTALVEATPAEPVEAEEEAAGEVAEIPEDAKEADPAEPTVDEAPADAEGEPTSMPDPSVVEEQLDNNDKAEAETPSLNPDQAPSADAEQADPVEAEESTEDQEATEDDDQKDGDSVLSEVQPLMNNATDSGLGLDPEVEAGKSQPASPSSGPHDLGDDADAEVPDLDSNGEEDAGNAEGPQEEVDESSKSPEPTAADETNEDMNTYSHDSSIPRDEPSELSDPTPDGDNLGEEPVPEDAAEDEPEDAQPEEAAEEAPAAHEEPSVVTDEGTADLGEGTEAHDSPQQPESDPLVEDATSSERAQAAEEIPESEDVEDTHHAESEGPAEDVTKPEPTEPAEESTNAEDVEPSPEASAEEPGEDSPESADVDHSDAAVQEDPVTVDETAESEEPTAETDEKDLSAEAEPASPLQSRSATPVPTAEVEHADAETTEVGTVEADDKSELSIQPRDADEQANEISDNVAEDADAAPQQDSTSVTGAVPEETVPGVSADAKVVEEPPSESDELPQPHDEQQELEQSEVADASVDDQDSVAAVEEKSIQHEGDDAVSVNETEQDREAPAPSASGSDASAEAQTEHDISPGDDHEGSQVNDVEAEAPGADIDGPVDASVDAAPVEESTATTVDHDSASEAGDEHHDLETYGTLSTVEESPAEFAHDDSASLQEDLAPAVEPDTSLGVGDYSGQSLSETVIVTEQDDSSQDITGQIDDDVEPEQSATGSVLDEQVDQYWREEPVRESQGHPTPDEEQQSEGESRERGVERQEEEDSYSAQEREPVEPTNEDHYSLPSYDEGDYPEYSIYADEMLGDSLYSSSEHVPHGYPTNNDGQSAMDQSRDASMSQTADDASTHLSVDTSFRGATHSPLPVENDTVRGEEDLFDDESASSHFSDEEDSEIIDSFAHEQRSVRDSYAQQSTPIQYDGASWGDVTEASLSEPYTAATTFQEPTPTQTTFNFANSFGIRMVNDPEKDNRDNAEPVKRSSTPTPLPSTSHGTAPDFSPHALQSAGSRSPNRGGLAASRHAPQTPTRMSAYAHEPERDEELDPSLFVPRDVTHQPWHTRNDSEPYSMRSQSTLSSGPPSPTHSAFPNNNKLDPVIRDSWHGTADGARSRANTDRNENGDFDPFKYDSPKSTPYDINSPRRSLQSHQPIVESNRNSLTTGSPMFQKLRSMFEAPSGNGSSSAQSSPTRSRPVSSIFATTGRERSTSQLRESHIPHDLTQSSVRSRYPNDREDEVHEHSALLRDSADRIGH